MIDIPYDDAVAMIHKQSGLETSEIERRVQEKLTQLSGLISRDGAIHIIANELGVQISKPVAAEGGAVKIKDISLSSRGVTVTGRVVRKYDVRSFDKNGRQGKVASLLLGDETGVTRLVFWNDQVDAFEELKDGDVLIVKNPFVKESYQKDRLELQLNQQSTLTVNPDGVVVEGRPSADRAPRQQMYLKDIKGGEENVEIVATIVQVYDPRFYDSCPKCRKKLVADNQCAEHGEVVGDVNWSMSAFLDDGTGNIRTSFWKDQSLALTGVPADEFSSIKDDPARFEDIKTELLGEIIKVVGTVKRNDAFDRMELTANLVFRDIDPAKELQNLEKKFEQDRKSSPAEPPRQEQKKPVEKPSSEPTVIEDDVVSLDDL